MLKTSIIALACSGFMLSSAAVMAAGGSAVTPVTQVLATEMNVAAQDEKVNINTATAAQLAAALRGVGLARAEAIVKLREELGRFTDVEQLLQVRGLGPKVLNDNRDKISL